MDSDGRRKWKRPRVLNQKKLTGENEEEAEKEDKVVGFEVPLISILEEQASWSEEEHGNGKEEKQRGVRVDLEGEEKVEEKQQDIGNGEQTYERDI